MEYDAYRAEFFVDPPPDPRFSFSGVYGISLFFEQCEEALAYYSRVLGPPTYVEGENTHGWPIAGSWLTLFPAREGNPRNAEFTLLMSSPAEADRLQQAFIDAGGSAEGSFDDLMYEPFHICPVVDPFGTNILIVARIEEE
jgi:uncharacterized glyoxalase superfamily protein PhnB